jgi:inosose dehydratase
MSKPLTRRDFGQTVLACVGAAAFPAFLSAADPRKLKIGCTTLIWGGLPNKPENLEPALKDMSELGYNGFETFASILEDWEKKGALAPLLQKYPIPLTSAYTTVNCTDPSVRKDQVAMLQRYAALVKKYGGRFLVQSSNNRGTTYNFAENRANIIAAYNEYGKAVTDMGIGTGLHQHTGSAVETRDETYAVMEAVDHKVFKFAPDVGQLQKGGADAAQVVKDFSSIIVHMHLKDYKGWDQMAGYCPLGQGVVDLKGILETMETANPNANIMHELDGSANQTFTPRQTAEIGKAYLQKLGYTFRR